MPLYPLFLDLRNRRCLVVGGGAVAIRKVRALLAAGARIEVVAPRIDPALAALARRIPKRLSLKRRAYAKRNLSGFALVFAATNNATVNALVASDAKRARVWCNRADDAKGADFHTATPLQRGDLQIAISTGGASPALAAVVRKELEHAFPAWYSVFTRALRRARKHVRDKIRDGKKRRAILEGMVTEKMRARMAKLKTSAAMYRALAAEVPVTRNA